MLSFFFFYCKKHETTNCYQADLPVAKRYFNLDTDMKPRLVWCARPKNIEGMHTYQKKIELLSHMIVQHRSHKTITTTTTTKTTTTTTQKRKTESVDASRKKGVDPGDVVEGSRTLPSGDKLIWKYTLPLSPPPFLGLVPFMVTHQDRSILASRTGLLFALFNIFVLCTAVFLVRKSHLSVLRRLSFHCALFVL